MIQTVALADIIVRLEKRAEQDRSYAENNTVVADLLETQMALFNAREGQWNTYAVRMAVDHRQSAKKDTQFADDLDAACVILKNYLEQEDSI